MKREEAVKLLQATRLMLMDGTNQPISDLYYALDMAIEALEQTESNSEKSNNCETCRFELYCPEICEGCCEWDSHYEPKDESFDKDINVRSKNEPQMERKDNE